MPQGLSISFTLGKASIQHQANIPHSNREFIAKNIDASRTHLNITYVKQNIEEAYHDLFDDSVKEYNDKQKRADRKILNYYENISNGKREEAYYELIVQYGDIETAPCGSENGNETKKMLNEYMTEFQKRNPNLYVFNAVMHLDEASPHLHINFVPFYTKERKNGLRKGVSMRAALDEQGFTNENKKNNSLVEWEESERSYMETILNKHGFIREDKNAKYAHKTVEQFKKDKDDNRIVDLIRKNTKVTSEDLSKTSTIQLQEKVRELQNKVQKLEKQKKSPYKSFYYSTPDKQAFMQSQLDLLGIPYHETETGFEAQEYYVDEIRKIEKKYVAPKSGYREALRQNIDLLLMQSNTIDEILDKLQKAGYQIKRGKYLAVKPSGAKEYIRLKSLGEKYNEYALMNRLKAKARFEQELDNRIAAETKRDTPKALSLGTIQLYIVTFKKGYLPMRRKDDLKPFSWTNDAELDKLLVLNKKINEGATLDTLRNDFEKQEEITTTCEADLLKSKRDLKLFYDLKEKVDIVYSGKKSSVYTFEQAQIALKQFPDINDRNFSKVQKLIDKEIRNIQEKEEAYSIEAAKLKEASELYSAAEKVMGGTYIQYIARDERHRRESDHIQNGTKNV